MTLRLNDSGDKAVIGGALVVRDLLDGQLESADHRHIGRVADLEAVWSDDGRLAITHILVGPQVLLGRLSPSLRDLAMRLVGERFLHRVPIADVEEVGPTIRLAGPSGRYSTDAGDDWVLEHILRFIPGSGRGAR